MRFIKDHPELDTERVESAVAHEHGNVEIWGDVFRRIGLDEGEHMNQNVIYVGFRCVRRPAGAGGDFGE